MSTEAIAFVLCVFFIAGIVKGLVGIGLPTITLALTSFVLPLSDMIALIPRRIAEGWSDRVQVLEPPLTIPGFVIASIWHERTTTHPAQSWLRDRLAALA